MQRRQQRGEAGLSLIEIMISLAIVGLVVGGATMGLRSLVKSELRSAAARIGAAIRYSYDRAISTGAYYRLHFDLDEQTYKLERSETRVLLTVQKEQGGRGGTGLDQDELAEEEEKERDRRAGGTNSGLPKELLPPPSPRRARFEEFKDASVPTVKLKRIKVLDIFTGRQKEPYTRGHAYLHFFPDGHTERAVIHLGEEAGDDDQYTLIIHGLTGRVEVRPGRVEAAAEFDAFDDAGEKRVQR